MEQKQMFSTRECFVFLLPFLVTLIDAACDKSHTCSSTDPKSVTFNGMEFSCSGNSICNKKYDEPCTFCVGLKCKVNFMCLVSHPKSVVINGSLMDCPDNKTCNAMYNEPCEPCISNDCPDFSCIVNEPTMVLINSTLFYCPNKMICNNNPGPTCDPCVGNTKSLGVLLKLEDTFYEKVYP